MSRPPFDTVAVPRAGPAAASVVGAGWGQVLALTFALAAAACGDAPLDAPTPRDPGDGPIGRVVLVTFDTTRADRLGCYGREQAETPVVDGLAARGVRALRCQTTAPVTLPAHASLLTGLYPFAHGARYNGTHVVPDDVVTLAETLRAAGWSTGAVVSAVVLDGRFGLDQGFDVYDDDLGAGDARSFEYLQTRADDTTDRAIRFVEAQGDSPYFLWVHYYDPHRPFDPPEPWAGRFGNRRHDGEIAFTDHELGRLLAAVERVAPDGRTLTIMTSDHGESFGEHGESGHGLFVYESTCHVPLIFHGPGLAAGATLAGVTSVVDVAPTVLELVGQPAPPGLHGRSLAPALRGEAADGGDRSVYAEAMLPAMNYGWSDLRSLTDDSGRYVRAPTPELYDHDDDPLELENRFARDDPRARRMATSLQALLADGERDAAAEALAADDELRAALARLGYAGAGSRAPADEELVDPKDRVAEYEQLAEVRRLLARPRPDRAETLLRRMLADSPGSPEPSGLLVLALMAQQKWEPARELAQSLVAGPRPMLEDFLNLAALQQRAGDAAWDETLRLAAARWPWATRPWVRLGVYRADTGDVTGAREAYLHALSLDEHDAEARAGLASLP